MLGGGRREERGHQWNQNTAQSPLAVPGRLSFLQRPHRETGRREASKTPSQFSGQAQPTAGGTGRTDRIAAQTSQGTVSVHKLTRRLMKNKVTRF